MKIIYPEEHALSVLENYMIGHDLTVKVDEDTWKADRTLVADSIGYLIADLHILAALMGEETERTVKERIQEIQGTEDIGKEHEADLLERKERVKLTLGSNFGVGES